MLGHVCSIGRGSEMVILMGLPAAGKSTIAGLPFGDSHRFFDCDSIKATHPDFDPKNPAALHSWSKARLAEEVAAVWSNPHNFVYDSTGTNPARIEAMIQAAREAGMKTRLLFVTVTQDVSLERNARRSRVVPENVILEKVEAVRSTFEHVRFMFDNVETFDNSREDPALDDRAEAV